MQYICITKFRGDASLFNRLKKERRYRMKGTFLDCNVIIAYKEENVKYKFGVCYEMGDFCAICTKEGGF
jgi:hypothetical protein